MTTQAVAVIEIGDGMAEFGEAFDALEREAVAGGDDEIAVIEGDGLGARAFARDDVDLAPVDVDGLDLGMNEVVIDVMTAGRAGSRSAKTSAGMLGTNSR